MQRDEGTWGGTGGRGVGVQSSRKVGTMRRKKYHQCFVPGQLCKDFLGRNRACQKAVGGGRKKLLKPSRVREGLNLGTKIPSNTRAGDLGGEEYEMKVMGIGLYGCPGGMSA